MQEMKQLLFFKEEKKHSIRYDGSNDSGHPLQSAYILRSALKSACGDWIPPVLVVSITEPPPTPEGPSQKTE